MLSHKAIVGAGISWLFLLGFFAGGYYSRTKQWVRSVTQLPTVPTDADPVKAALTGQTTNIAPSGVIKPSVTIRMPTLPAGIGRSA